jgi:hypothetical protein
MCIVQQMTFLFSFSFLFGVEQNCIFINNVHRGECVGTEEAQREYKEEAHSFIVVVLFGSPPLTRQLGPASSILAKQSIESGNVVSLG